MEPQKSFEAWPTREGGRNKRLDAIEEAKERGAFEKYWETIAEAELAAARSQIK
jgi:hypothetical protein